MSRIYLSAPDVRAHESDYLLAALDSGWVAPVGPELAAFEREIGAVVGIPNAVALASGTAALHLALVGLGVGHGDSVIVSSFTFVASVNPIAYLRATPVLVDSEAESWNMSPDLLAEELAERARRGCLPKAAVVVDLYGQCADYGRIRPLLEEYDVALVEDAAEAFGARYQGQAAGSFGRASVLSFNGNKIITTSSGGMFLSSNAEIAARVRHLATQAKQAAVHFEHTEIGYNYRMSNLLAALGRAQLLTLSARIERRREINAQYIEALSCLPGVTVAPVAPGNEPNYWITCITVDPRFAGTTARDVGLALELADIEARPTWKPMHLQPLYRDAPARIDGTSQRLFEQGLCLPSGSGMSDVEQDRVISVVLGAVEGRVR